MANYIYQQRFVINNVSCTIGKVYELASWSLVRVLIWFFQMILHLMSTSILSSETLEALYRCFYPYQWSSTVHIHRAGIETRTRNERFRVESFRDYDSRSGCQ